MLYGRCDLESLVPYQPFVAALQHYIAQRETLTLPRELEPELAELARFIPALRRPGASVVAASPLGETVETRRYRLFEAVTRLLAYAAREAPVVLVLDDLHWADTSTALLLAHLLGDLEPACQLVLGTIRDADGHRSAELTDLLARLAREPEFARIALRGLSGGETHALAEAVGHRVTRLVRAAPAREHRGQPVLHQGDAAQRRRGVRRRRPGGRQGADRHAAGAARRDRQPAAERGIGDRSRVRPRSARGAGRRARGARSSPLWRRHPTRR